MFEYLDVIKFVDSDKSKDTFVYLGSGFTRNGENVICEEFLIATNHGKKKFKSYVVDIDKLSEFELDEDSLVDVSGLSADIQEDCMYSYYKDYLGVFNNITSKKFKDKALDGYTRFSNRNLAVLIHLLFKKDDLGSCAEYTQEELDVINSLSVAPTFKRDTLYSFELLKNGGCDIRKTGVYTLKEMNRFAMAC